MSRIPESAERARSDAALSWRGRVSRLSKAEVISKTVAHKIDHSLRAHHIKQAVTRNHDKLVTLPKGFEMTSVGVRTLWGGHADAPLQV